MRLTIDIERVKLAICLLQCLSIAQIKAGIEQVKASNVKGDVFPPNGDAVLEGLVAARQAQEDYRDNKRGNCPLALVEDADSSRR